MLAMNHMFYLFTDVAYMKPYLCVFPSDRYHGMMFSIHTPALSLYHIQLSFITGKHQKRKRPI